MYVTQLTVSPGGHLTGTFTKLRHLMVNEMFDINRVHIATSTISQGGNHEHSFLLTNSKEAGN